MEEYGEGGGGWTDDGGMKGGTRMGKDEGVEAEWGMMMGGGEEEGMYFVAEDDEMRGWGGWKNEGRKEDERRW